MRYLILSDIHSNLEALEACVQRAKTGGLRLCALLRRHRRIWPNPIEAIDWNPA
jgi:hypothetical protein